MAGSSLLTAEPLHGGDYGSFNWIFLVEYIFCGILCLWFLFYFNRIFATLISYAVRLFTWHVFGISVDIEALQVSILAGRVFFKGIHYYGDNETIFIHGGYITWRYWLRKVKPCRLFEERDSKSRKHRASSGNNKRGTGEEVDELEDDSKLGKHGSLPCRVEVRVSGIEAFIYNRGPAYDYILETCAQHSASAPAAQAEAAFTARSEKSGDGVASLPKHRSGSVSTPSSASSGFEDGDKGANTSPAAGARDQIQTPNARYKPPSPPSILRLLPVSVHCNKAAAVLGNENTPSILTAKIDSANGEFDASESGPLDVFKILMHFHVNKPFVQMKPNVDYKRPQLAEAALLETSIVDGENKVLRQNSHSKADITADKTKSKKRRWSGFPGLSRKAMQSLDSIAMFPGTLTSSARLPDAHVATPNQGRWLGLARYLHDNQRKDEDEWQMVDYAKASTLADLNSVDFKFYWDIGGARPPSDGRKNLGQASTTRNANGGDPPEYGMELFVHGGTVHYGPWADRHRILLQQLFFPQPLADPKPINIVASGETRLCTIFDLFVSVEADTVLRIPFREPSKDYKWKGRAETTNRKPQDQSGHRRRRRNADQTAHSTHARPYAWFDILIKPNTTIKYTQDIFPTLNGYKNDLRVDVGGIEMHSSLNHALLWRSGSVTVQADLSNPLRWNGLHEWTFEIGINDLEFFLLRDHAVLLMDLIEDWTTGPLPEFFTFVPYRYILKPKFDQFKLFLNVNDANIVDQSDNIDDNEFVILYGRSLVSELLIPVERFRPPQNTISFDVKAYDLGFELSMPPKNTLNAFLANKDLAQLPEVDLKGAYVLCSEVQAGLVETLTMEIIGRGLRIAFYGFFARHLAKIKENYFGDDVHFRTLQEYQELVRNDFKSNEPQPPIRGNDLDVILDITAEDAHIMLPAGLYSCEEYVELFVDTANVDLRVNNYYLELMVDSCPLQLRYCEKIIRDDDVAYHVSEPQLTIDSVNVYGHRLFGLPPSEPAYVSNWDIDAGDILGQCTTEFVAKMASSAQALALTITDEENGLPIPEAAPLYDTTLVRWRSGLIRLWLQVQHDAFLFGTKDVHGYFNDRATQMFSQHLVLDAPEIVLACVHSQQPVHKLSADSTQETLAYLKTTASVRMVQRAANFAAAQEGQECHTARQDFRTDRAAFLTNGRRLETNAAPVSLCLPCLPGPLLQSASRQHSRRVAGTFPQNDSRCIFSAGSETEAADDRPAESISATPMQKLSGKSVFVTPVLPGNRSTIDLTDVPFLPNKEYKIDMPASATDNSLFNNVDEDSAHTSVRISTGSGVVLLCKPQAVLAASEILDTLSPRDLEAVYDSYQMETASGVLSILQKQRGQRFILDLGFVVPYLHVRLVNAQLHSNNGTPPASPLEDSDEYNLVASEISSTVRIKSMPDRKHADDLKAVHLTLSSILLSAKQAPKLRKTANVAFESKISNILLWLADSDRTIVNASYDDFETRVASNELDFLAALIHRAADLAEILASPFLAIQSTSTKRRRFVVCSLVQAGRDIADPSFLTRPSYMIRSAQDHLRNSDSWKIVARLRWTLCRLTREQRVSLWAKCRDGEIDLPKNSEETILVALDQWRSWDTTRIKDSLAMQLLFGSHTIVEKAHDPGSVPLSVNVRGSGLEMTIDHGHKKNSIKLEGLQVAVSVKPPPPPSAMQLFKEIREVRLTVVHLSTARASINLNWELFNLADDVMNLYEESTFLQGQAPSPTTITQKDKISLESKEELHLVIQMDSAQTKLEAISITQTFSSKDLQISIGANQAQPELGDTLVTVVASAQEAAMTTHDSASLLLDVRLDEASLAVAYQDCSETNTPGSLHVGAVSHHLGIDFRQDIACFVDITDRIVVNEANHIKDLIHRHTPETSSVGMVTSGPKKAHPLHVNLTLFMDSYALNMSLVQDLSYKTEGRVLRLGVLPDHGSHLSHIVDFDLEAQKHTFSRGDVAHPLARSTLTMPSINGSVRIMLSPTLLTLSTSVVIERVSLEGLALYGIFSMLSSSGIIQAAETIYEDIQALQATIKSTFPSAVQPQSKSLGTGESSAKLTFDASLSLVGFAVTAHTRKSSQSSGPIGVIFNMGTTNIRASNRSSIQDQALPFPELCLTLGRMETRVERQHDDGTQKSAEVVFGLVLSCVMKPREDGDYTRIFDVSASGPSIELDEYTSPILVGLLGHFQDRMKSLDLTKEKQYLRRLRRPARAQHSSEQVTARTQVDASTSTAMPTTFAFDLKSAYITYVIRHRAHTRSTGDAQDLTFSLKQIQFHTRGEKEARLRIDEVKLQMLPRTLSWTQRSANSALLPELIFTVSYESLTDERKLLFHAAGKALDVQLHPDCVQPAAELEQSLATSAASTRIAIAQLRAQPKVPELAAPRMPPTTKRLSLMIIDTNFAGAIVRLRERDPHDMSNYGLGVHSSAQLSGLGRYSNLPSDSASRDATLRAPGIAVHVQYTDNAAGDPCLNVEIKIDQSKNVLTPAVVPLILRMAHNVKETMHQADIDREAHPQQGSPLQKPAASGQSSTQHDAVDESLIRQSPRALLGRTRLNIGMRIARQEFALVCQPIAKVEARMKLDDTYLTINTVDSPDEDTFFAISIAFNGMEASLKHVYSRDPTFQFYIESVVISAMNSKHIGGRTGISAILKINPMKAHLNAKQLQDVLLFREIWLPPEIRDASMRSTTQSFEEQQEYFASRYRQIATAAAFPWSATLAIADLDVELDLGQAIGKLSAQVSQLWASSKKTTSAQSTLCVGVEKISIDASGRMSGFVMLNQLKVRTSIAWPTSEGSTSQTPLVQGSVGFRELRLKAAFDYQVFAISHVTSFEFIMYNVRDNTQHTADRLVAILDGDKVHAYCVASTAALAVSLAQAFERLIQERKTSYEQSLQDIDSFLRRRTTAPRASIVSRSAPPTQLPPSKAKTGTRLPISLQTDVVVTLGSMDVGAFPRTVLDSQILRLETSAVQAHFAVAVEGNKLHTGLGLTLGQVRAALSSVPQGSAPKSIGDIEIDEVVRNATLARGGIILRVPKVVAAMQTWQLQGERAIDFKFRSTFEGKIDVGWNYSRISFIRGMWTTHTRTLATRLGKPLPESALKITGPQPLPEIDERGGEPSQQQRKEEQSKITVTANVNLPQSGYTYRALEPAVIDTPQLRDMGEATPPLEWIGLNRDKLPNVTHQVVVVTLLEVAKEVEDAYTRILG